MHKIAIFRHTLFKQSEVFIHQQGVALERYKPVFVGLKIADNIPENVEYYCTTSLSGLKHVTSIIKYALMRDPKIFLPYFDNNNISIIHAHTGIDGLYSLEIAKKLEIPLVTTFHGYDATTTDAAFIRSIKPTWINYVLFRKKLAKEGNLFICVSKYIREKVLGLGFPADRTIIHYIGIDTQSIRPYKIISNKKIILHVARFTEKKGTKYLLHAFSRIVKKDKDVKLVIIGEGPLKKKIESLIESLNIKDYVHLLGFQPHECILEWMARSRMICVPSIIAHSGDSEGLPIVLLEAAAMGIPAVATLHSGIPEGCIDGKTGFLVPERSVEELAERLTYLLKNESLCEELGRAARRMVELKFNILNQTKKLESLYDSLC